MSNFEIFKQNQVLYIEYGFIYVTLICLMIFLPLEGITNVVSSVILFWLFIAMFVLLKNQNIKKELEELVKDLSSNLKSKSSAKLAKSGDDKLKKDTKSEDKSKSTKKISKK